MIDYYVLEAKTAVNIIPLTLVQMGSWLKQQSAVTQRWVQACGFNADPGSTCFIANQAGELKTVLFGIADANDFWVFGALPTALPENEYHINNDTHFLNAEQYRRALIAWGLGCYQFNVYVKREKKITCKLLVPQAEFNELKNLVSTIYLVRDLINLPAADMGPVQLAAAAKKIALENKAKFKVIVGEQLLKENFPTIYAVGRGAEQEPRLIDIRWGDASAPKVTLVGKGVCFDSGGLDMKSAANMREMKKDMGGAAHALGLARLIMLANLPVNLRVLIPAVENAVDARSYHPGDIIKTRGGYSVEVDNTDAEGRLVLCDALAEAVTEKPDYLIDFATLTGAARVALGPDLPAMFCNNDRVAAELLIASEQMCDPMWRLPLYQPYRSYLKTNFADMLNASKVPMAGAITAGLFLQTYVPDDIPWVHFDIAAANSDTRPGRPAGGEAMALRSVLHFLKLKF